MPKKKNQVSMSNTALVRQHYRGLLRAMQTTFKNDVMMLNDSRKKCREEVTLPPSEHLAMVPFRRWALSPSQMEKHRGVIDPVKIKQLLLGLDEVADFLLTQARVRARFTTEVIIRLASEMDAFRKLYAINRFSPRQFWLCHIVQTHVNSKA